MTHPNSLKSQVVTEVHEKIVGDWYAYFVAGPMVYVDFGDYRLSMFELMHQVLGYFKWIFEDDNIAFPLELQNQLELCRIRPET